ncbi:MAG: hypothetical protein ACJATA_001210 [Sphingobacteriales bacterium]|jgi:hypothetical protein
MQSKATTVKEYLIQIPEESQVAFDKLRNIILKNLPEGFSEQVNYGMVGFVVPHSIYPNRYHCSAKDPLPFANITNQKNSSHFTLWGFMPARSF